jgi:hypothetical protein
VEWDVGWFDFGTQIGEILKIKKKIFERRLFLNVLLFLIWLKSSAESQETKLSESLCLL